MSNVDPIVKEITINAPAHRVFHALTDPAERTRWWGVPGKFQTTHMESDLRPGGAWLMRGIGPAGAPFTLSGQYLAVTPPHSLEFTWSDSNAQSDPPTVVRFDLTESVGVTTVRLTHSGFTQPSSRDRYQGWPWLLSLLQAHVQSNPSN